MKKEHLSALIIATVILLGFGIGALVVDLISLKGEFNAREIISIIVIVIALILLIIESIFYSKMKKAEKAKEIEEK